MTGKTYAFIDASNLFYGGEKSLGWKIDYLKLIKYLKNKYKVSEVFYFGGVETHGYKYDYLESETVPLKELEKRLVDYIDREGKKLDEAKLLLLSRHLQRIRFYLKLQEFGYKLYLKPVKTYYQEDGKTERKANCDVEMAFYLMKEKNNFDRVLVLSGDGDFLPVLKYLKETGKEVIVLARGPRTAKEIRQFAGSNFRDFVRLEKDIKFEKKA
ncbi:NYN domain-containing protein [Candidatus Daviesbacteria bacterium]|nr:NYN domain-containing protein [Candidatus Daviesbacteria bacterium]